MEKQKELAKVITTTIDGDIYELAQAKKIRWSDALRLGIKVICDKDDLGRTYEGRIRQLETALKLQREATFRLEQDFLEYKKKIGSL